MKKTIIIAISLLFSCASPQVKQKVVNGKLEQQPGIYRISFTDGSCVSVNFGRYNKYNIGDTIYFTRLSDNHLWRIK